MNYTETYRKIYSSIKTETMPHEVAHYATLRITDAISHIYQTSQVYREETLDIIKDVIAEFKIGGYDLDDSGQIASFGTSATGLNNNK